MDALSTHYCDLLGYGLLAIRQALDTLNYEWAGAEVEFLHNIPSLIGESNVERHRYFWFTERIHYLEWVRNSGLEPPQQRARVFYEPTWAEMEPHLLEWFAKK